LGTARKQAEFMARIAKELGREVATGDDARRIMKIGTWYESAVEQCADAEHGKGNDRDETVTVAGWELYRCPRRYCPGGTPVTRLKARRKLAASP
jgi:hypothetical protein